MGIIGEPQTVTELYLMQHVDNITCTSKDETASVEYGQDPTPTRERTIITTMHQQYPQTLLKEAMQERQSSEEQKVTLKKT